MKKLLPFLLALLIFSLGALATVATYQGEASKQGSEAVFVVGYASDQEARISLDVPDREGINISYTENYSFVPSDAPRRVSRKGEDIPLKKFQIKVVSDNPTKKEYSLSVSLKASSPSESTGTASPKVVQEREYGFTFITQSSSDYDFDGGLIKQGSNHKVDDADSENTSLEENSLTSENQTFTQKGQNKNNDSGGNTTLILAFGIVLVFTYTVYEAVT